MKKFLVAIMLSLTVLAGAIIKPNFKASAMELNNDEADIVFMQNINELINEQYDGDVQIEATKENLYDMDLNQLGYVYDFSTNGDEGFAIVINTNGHYELQELYFNTENPYADTNGLRIYIAFKCYAIYADDTYCCADGITPISEDLVSEFQEIGYCAYVYSHTSINTQISYVTRTENGKVLAARYPACHGINSLTNECAPVAVASIIKFYDRYETELIQNYTPGFGTDPNYLYKEQDATTESLISQLYSSMGTNTNGAGTTVTQCLNALTSYVTNAGSHIRVNQIMNESGFNYPLARTYLGRIRPILIFCQTFNVGTITNDASTNTDTFNGYYASANHAMAAFGFKRVNYEFADGTARTDEYLLISTGESGTLRGYMNANVNAVINDAYAVTVN